jgi:hypothetical protein
VSREHPKPFSPYGPEESELTGVSALYFVSSIGEGWSGSALIGCKPWETLTVQCADEMHVQHCTEVEGSTQSSETNRGQGTEGGLSDVLRKQGPSEERLRLSSLSIPRPICRAIVGNPRIQGLYERSKVWRLSLRLVRHCHASGRMRISFVRSKYSSLL